MISLDIAIALLAGIVLFAFPAACCLPPVPAHVSYMVGTTTPGSPEARRVAFHQALAFVLGFTDAAVSLVAGAMLIGVGFLMITNLFLKLSGFVPNFVI